MTDDSRTEPAVDPVRARCFESKRCYQLMRGTRIVGLAMAYADGSWRAHDLKDDVISDRFSSPKAVAGWAQRVGLGT